MANRSGLLPVQAWDEINVTNDRTKTTQKQEASKEMKEMLRLMKKGQKKKNGKK